jgi:hypothetical protein
MLERVIVETDDADKQAAAKVALEANAAYQVSEADGSLAVLVPDSRDAEEEVINLLNAAGVSCMVFLSDENGEKNRPLYDYRSGRVQGAIWDREGPNGETRYQLSLYRSFTDKEGNWKQTTSFDPQDIQYVKAIITKAEETLTQELGVNVTEGVTVTQKKTQGQKESL